MINKQPEKILEFVAFPASQTSSRNLPSHIRHYINVHVLEQYGTYESTPSSFYGCFTLLYQYPQRCWHSSMQRGLGTVTSEISALRMHSVTTNSRPIEEVHS